MKRSLPFFLCAAVLILPGALPALDQDIASHVTGDIYARVKTIDLDGDGKQEMIFGASDGAVHVYDYRGEELNIGAFPFQTGGPILSEVMFHRDKDGGLQVYTNSMDGRLYRIDAAQGLKWSFQPGGSMTFAPPELVKQEDNSWNVWVATRGGKVVRVREDGQADWTVQMSSPVVTPIQVGRTGAPGADRSYLVVRDTGGEIHYFEPEGPGTSTELWKAKVSNGDGFWPYPLHVRDLDLSGRMEVYTETGRPHTIVRLNNGQQSKLRPSDVKSSCSFRFFDLDNDGYEEIIYTENTQDDHAQLVVTDRRGKEMPDFPWKMGRGSMSSAPPTIADVDGDGRPDILFTWWQVKENEVKGWLDAVDLKGRRLQGFPRDVGKCVAPVTVADLDGDGLVEIIVPGGMSETGKQLHVLRSKGRVPVRVEIVQKIFRLESR